MVPWHDNYNVGIEVMDTQHRRMVHLLNHVQMALSGEEDRGKLTLAVSDLRRYTGIHFFSEEEFLRRSRFPDLPIHIEEHRRLLDGLETLERSVRDEDALSTTESLLALFASMEEHLVGPDRDYGLFIRQNRRLLT